MKILPTHTTQEVIDSLNKEYPMLTIKFYKGAHAEFEGSQRTDEVIEVMPLVELNSSIKAAEVEIGPDVTAGGLEAEFETKLGLHVQLFRKSGDAWLQTSKTDHWTLAKHQQKAAESEV